MLDMIRRLSEGREASRLRKERRDSRLGHLQRTGEPSPLPNTTPEEMGRIIKQSEEKKEKDNSYFVWGTLLVMAALIGSALILWVIFLR